jgi:hypothetical protein
LTKETSIDIKKYIKTEKRNLTSLTKRKESQRKIHQKMKMSKAKRGLTKEANIKTKIHQKRKMKEAKND